jgi:hypothetical protein
MKNNWWQSYNAYLQTEHWARLRESRLRVDRHHCTRYGLGRDLQVHHVRYRDPLWSGRSKICERSANAVTLPCIDVKSVGAKRRENRRCRRKDASP